MGRFVEHALANDAGIVLPAAIESAINLRTRLSAWPKLMKSRPAAFACSRRSL
jgi:hypothetical protein